MIFNSENIAFRLAVSERDYADFRDSKSDEGFRTISLALSGSASAPRYTGVMARYDPPFSGRSVLRCDEQRLRQTIAEMAEDGLGPYIIAATGPGDDAAYAAAFRQMPGPVHVELRMTVAHYQAKNAEHHAEGNIPLWIDSFGSGPDIHYCAIWVPNREGVAWNAEALNDSGDERQERFDAMVSVRARPWRVAVTPLGGVARIYVDSQVRGGWAAEPVLTRIPMMAAAAKQAEDRRFPVCIGAAVVGGVDRFSAIFAKGDEIVGRTFRINGPAPTGLAESERSKPAMLDAYMENFVRQHNVRGAALAVVENTRLVFAKGYTFAEPDYPDIEPTTLFRMASVSKTFCAVAVWKALADDRDVSRETTMQSVLGLTTPNGLPPVAADFRNVTIRHLLESNSGIDQTGVRDSVKQHKKTVGLQPLTVSQIAKMIAERPMAGEPGTISEYGRTDYFLLGLVAARLAGVPGFDAALKKLVLDPLGMRRTRGARSRADHRQADEALHHLYPGLETGISAVHTHRPIVPKQYGVENYEVYGGAGGVSSAIVDLARLCAMFSCDVDNPVLAPNMLQAMFDDAVAATDAGSSHGYHGFDAAAYEAGSTSRFTLRKGGVNPGVRAGFTGTTGRRFYLIAYNGEPIADTGLDWKADVAAIADSIDWGDGDPFQRFGMAPLASSRRRVKVGRFGGAKRT